MMDRAVPWREVASGQFLHDATGGDVDPPGDDVPLQHGQSVPHREAARQAHHAGRFQADAGNRQALRRRRAERRVILVSGSAPLPPAVREAVDAVARRMAARAVSG